MPKSSRASPHGEGYIMLYRKSLTSAVFQDAKTWKVWSWCVLRANWQGIPLDYAGEEIVLKRGQFYTGTYSMMGELRMSRSSVWRHLKKLEKWGNIGIETKSHGTVITVINYDVYQDPSRSEFVNDGNEMGTQWEPSGNPAGTQREQIKKERSKEPKEVKKRIYTARPKSIGEIRGYFLELGESDDSAAWWDHFEGNGWKVGRNPMADWKATVRTWIRNGKKWGSNGRTNSGRGRTQSSTGGVRGASTKPGKYSELTNPGSSASRDGDDTQGGTGNVNAHPQAISGQGTGDT